MPTLVSRKKSLHPKSHIPNPTHGFTLVELLITISILVLLSTIGIVTYSQVFKSGRDAKRQSDLKTIQSALEQYRADQGFYPDTIPFGGALTNAGKTYLKEIPQDPTRPPDYSYTVLGAPGSDYCLYARVENSANEKNTACIDDPDRKLEVTKP